MKLKYRLVKFERAIAFQVLEMDERFRSSGSGSRALSYEGPIMAVRSVAKPELGSDEVFLRGGSKRLDLIVEMCCFPSNDARDEYATKLHAALKDWSENWPGFKEDTTPNQQDGDTFVL